MSAPRLLETRVVEKVWGRETLPSPFIAPPGKRIGEIWFEPPGELPSVLAKYLFTSEKLSVQVHPGEGQVQDGEQAKEECWIVLDAEDGASLAIGFREDVTLNAIRTAALDGSIEAMLEWHPVTAGDFFYLPAGTVHAIGPGVALVEIQQNSDTTFRLYDYGRPRELHLDRAMAVARPEPYSDTHRQRIGASGQCLVEGPHFRLDRIVGAPDEATKRAYDEGLLALPLAGSISAQGERAEAGTCLYASSIEQLDFGACEVALLTRAAG